MSFLDIRTVQVVYKKSAYELCKQKHKDPHLSALLAEEHHSVQWMLAAHQENQAALEHVRSTLKKRNIRSRWSYRAKPASLRGIDLVLAVGGDGTLLEAARMIQDDTPLLGMRSTPSESVGFLCAGDATACAFLLDTYLSGQLPLIEVSRIEVLCNGKAIYPLALNDLLFSHGSPAATSRYRLSLEGEKKTFPSDTQRSSGLWVASATGSTAAIRSAGGERMPLGDERLQFMVRELYKREESPEVRLEKGFVEANESLMLHSLMRKAYLFFDGPWCKRPILYGDVLQFRRAEQPLRLARPMSYLE